MKQKLHYQRIPTDSYLAESIIEDAAAILDDLEEAEKRVSELENVLCKAQAILGGEKGEGT